MIAYMDFEASRQRKELQRREKLLAELIVILCGPFGRPMIEEEAQ